MRRTVASEIREAFLDTRSEIRRLTRHTLLHYLEILLLLVLFLLVGLVALFLISKFGVSAVDTGTYVFSSVVFTFFLWERYSRKALPQTRNLLRRLTTLIEGDKPILRRRRIFITHYLNATLLGLSTLTAVSHMANFYSILSPIFTTCSWVFLTGSILLAIRFFYSLIRTAI